MYPLKEKVRAAYFFLSAAGRMAAECRALILWQMVIIRIERLFCKCDAAGAANIYSFSQRNGRDGI